MDEFNFVLYSEDGTSFKVSPDSALVFLDETGDSQLSDKNYPIFGFGGCCILAKDYMDAIHNPWSNLKKNHFELKDKPLHAADIKFNNNQITELNNFFITHQFGRFAVLMSKNTSIDFELSPEYIVYADFYNRIIEILKYYNFENIVIIYEDSKKLKPKLESYAAGIILSEKINEVDNNIEIYYYAMSKQIAFPGLEIADIIVHTAGTSLRDKINGKITNLIERKDFSNIFEKIEKQHSSFLYIEKAVSNPI